MHIRNSGHFLRNTGHRNVHPAHLQEVLISWYQHSWSQRLGTPVTYTLRGSASSYWFPYIQNEIVASLDAYVFLKTRNQLPNRYLFDQWTCFILLVYGSSCRNMGYMPR